MTSRSKFFLFIFTIITIATSYYIYKEINAVNKLSWSAGNMISDTKFTDSNSMNTSQIQSFLNNEVGTGPSGITGQCDTNGSRTSELGGGTRAQYGATHNNPAPFTCLKDYYEVPKLNPGPGIPNNNYGGKPIPSGAKSAAQLIWDAAQQYNISPKVLLVKLGTESAGPLTSDDWPFLNQYTYAMGSHCPDSGPNGSANCDTDYSGFSIQISSAAALLRYYLDNMTQPWWPYKKPYQNNNILWNVVERNCGSSNVFIQNKATAALYTYTPYQPNQAALDNMYSTGDSCSAYGNRNFWRTYNDWFGPTSDDITYVQSDISAYKYIIYDGKKQKLSEDSAAAWGIDKLPLNTLPQSALDLIPSTATDLSRVAVIEGTSSQVFADGSNYYDIDNNIKPIWGNFNNVQVSTIPWKLLNIPRFGGLLPTIVNKGTGLYLMENGTLHYLTSPTILRLWSGQSTSIIKLSDSYLSNLIEGSPISNNLATVGDKTYMLDNNNYYLVPSKILSLYPNWQPTPINVSFLNKFNNSGTLSHLIKSPSSSTIYATDNNKKRAITSFQVFNELRNNDAFETSISQDAISIIPEGEPIRSSILQQSPDIFFIVNKTASSIPTRLISEYSAINISTPVTASFIQIFDNSTKDATQFIKKSDTPGVYFLNNGSKIPINRYDVLYLLGGENSITTLSDNDFNSIPTSSEYPTMKPIIKSGLNVSIIDKSSLFTLPAEKQYIADSWNISSPITVSPETYSWIINNRTATSQLSQHIQTQNGEFCFVDITRYCAEQHGTIFIWDLLNGVIHPSDTLLNYLNINRSGPLSPFITSLPGQKYAQNVFTMVDGIIYYITKPDILSNLGFNGQILKISSSTIENLKSIYPINGYLLKDAEDNTWVIDNGLKRKVDNEYKINWTGSGLAAMATSIHYINSFPESSKITNSITNSSVSAIYGIDNGNKRAISSYQKYIQSWSPYSDVSKFLLNIIPLGEDL